MEITNEEEIGSTIVRRKDSLGEDSESKRVGICAVVKNQNFVVEAEVDFFLCKTYLVNPFHFDLHKAHFLPTHAKNLPT